MAKRVLSLKPAPSYTPSQPSFSTYCIHPAVKSLHCSLKRSLYMVFWLCLWLLFGLFFLFMQLRKLANFRSQHRFPQPSQDSTAILLKVVLQVSYEETSHMGKLQATNTWNATLRSSQIIHGRSRSMKVKGRANQRVQRWHDSVLSTWTLRGTVLNSRRHQHTWRSLL